jgi:hypothetical protein
VLEHVRGRSECGIDVAAAELEVEGDVRTPAAFEMLEVSEGPGGT